VLRRPELSAAAAQVAQRFQLDETGWIYQESPSISALAFLLLYELERAQPNAEQARLIARTLWSCVDGHGRLRTHREPESDTDPFQDFYPGQALLALARAAEAKLTEPDLAQAARALRYYGHRFRQNHSFGAVSWLAQAAAAWWKLTGKPEHAQLAFEVTDFALAYQQTKTGGFIGPLQPEAPGFTTGLFLEAVAAAHELAQALGDEPRAERYRRSGERGLCFLTQLVFQEGDEAVLPNLPWALGGVRASLVRSAVRLDFVQHALAAVLGFWRFEP
jgi:hypothetical protein